MKKSEILQTDDCATHFIALGSDALKHVEENIYNDVILFCGELNRPFPLSSNIDQIKQLFKLGMDERFDIRIYHSVYPSIHVFTY